MDEKYSDSRYVDHILNEIMPRYASILLREGSKRAIYETLDMLINSLDLNEDSLDQTESNKENTRVVANRDQNLGINLTN